MLLFTTVPMRFLFTTRPSRDALRFKCSRLMEARSPGYNGKESRAEAALAVVHSIDAVPHRRVKKVRDPPHLLYLINLRDYLPSINPVEFTHLVKAS